jgi:hypothetical protein
MWTGRRFRLRKDLNAIEKIEDREVRTIIPEGETVEVTGGPHPNYIRVVEMHWLTRVFVAFAVDLQACGDEIKGTSATE